jgi:hypothetical protein
MEHVPYVFGRVEMVRSMKNGFDVGKFAAVDGNHGFLDSQAATQLPGYVLH